MADSVPFAVTSNLRLASADFLEFGKQYDVMEELEELKNTIESINAKLLDADDKQDQDDGVRVWIRRFKKVLHTADDSLDDLAIQFRRDKLGAAEGKVDKVLLSISSSNQLPLYTEMPDKIKQIRESFTVVIEDMDKLNLSPGSLVKQTNSDWRETCSFVLESDIIGRDDSKKEIITMLRQPHENRKVSVIAIVGLGGLGKTTLAQLVYNDLEVQNCFEKKMWVCVSDNFDVKTILKKILESVTRRQTADGSSLDYLQEELRENLSDKKYLLVLDDIWNERRDKWIELRKYLMCGAQDSKILVTTRSENVAEAMTASTSYPLKGLTDEASWSLLKSVAFEDDFNGVNQNLESTGKEIAKKCKGVPLVVKTLGGLLRRQNEESEWENVLLGGFWKLCEEQNSIMPILKLSYRNLSPEMRQCFAYCSLYSKDSEIEKDELIQLWMAQGYLKCSTEKQHMEDVGNQFVEMFLMNSFFQDAENDEYGEIISFKMHDLMHDLAMLVAGNDYCFLDRKAEKVEGRPMHVSLESDEAIHLLKSLDPRRLRTLILPDDLEEEEDLSAIAEFKYLRVLRMHHLYDSTEHLKHLRYLDLTHQTSLPKSMSNLVFLQTLKLEEYDEESFSVVTKLVNLRCLDIDDYDSHLNRVRDVALESQNLRKCCCLPPLERLPSLKSLAIHSLNELEYIDLYEDGFALSFFPSLESLFLRGCPKLRGWRRRGDDINNSHNLSLPLSFPHLSRLEVYKCPQLTCMPTFPNVKNLRWDECSAEPLIATLNSTCSADSSSSAAPLSMLKELTISDHMNLPKGWMQNLTSLESLQIIWCESETLEEFETEFKVDTNCHLPLRKISISRCKNLKALPDWICNLSSLQHIILWDCPNLASLPEGMSDLTNLKIFEVKSCSLLVKECRTETSVVSRQIAHIPQIILSDY
ncbi:disease resistance protein RGA2-like [Abrus precatorius]|uniref:Disease resistance protein RGA2-like n=1 Tax=Abrus precatorius TaxID=3816 RepID=A0A8B8JZW8_ABRPR|nr:disease resistance protein RGA2-like [Abrus precatorius]